MMPPAARRRVRTAADSVFSGFLGSWRATASGAHVALTFDDGPDPFVTPELLDLLDEVAAPSTFFLLVDQCRQFPDLAKEVALRGHEIGLHGVDHRRLTEMPSAAALAYLRTARQELQEVTGQDVRLYRPPFGAQTVRSYVATRRAGMEVVVWSADAADWVDRSSAEVALDALDAISPGGILLLHERLEPDPLRGAPATTFDRCEVVRTVTEGCRERGLEPATVGALVKQYGAVRTAWFRP
jgi:peptidoglycan/xylan/chitin deacetylase (PgdA/CDA1 family)